MTHVARCTYHTRLAGWLSALAATATFAFLHAADQRLPIIVPISFDGGHPDVFAAKSPGLVYLPFGLQLALGVVFAAVVAVVLGRRHDTGDGRDAERRAVAEHTAEGVALIAAVWIAFQWVNAWRLTELWRHTFDPYIEIYVLALLTAFTASLMIGARVVVKVQQASGDRPLGTPVLDGRRRAATAGLAALLALGIGAPVVLLSMVWAVLKQYS
ncbi:MAG: hypothetical protein AB7U83_03105 [Vicinamibacterales bacterium]